MRFIVHYDMLADYNGHIEGRWGNRSFPAKDEADAIQKVKNFFNVSPVINWDAIIESEDEKFIAYLERQNEFN